MQQTIKINMLSRIHYSPMSALILSHSNVDILVFQEITQLLKSLVAGADLLYCGKEFNTLVPCIFILNLRSFSLSCSTRRISAYRVKTKLTGKFSNLIIVPVKIGFDWFNFRVMPPMVFGGSCCVYVWAAEIHPRGQFSWVTVCVADCVSVGQDHTCLF